MRHKKYWIASAIFILVLASCSGDDEGLGFSKTDLDAAIAARGAAESGLASAQADLASAQADLASAREEVSSLQSDMSDLEAQLADALVPNDLVQGGDLAAAPAPVPLPDDGWATAESVRGGLWLVASFDSEAGPDAWDIVAHPRVYFTSESYASSYFQDTDEGKTLAADPDFKNFAGFHVIDAYSKEVIAAKHFQLDPTADITRGPHGVGVSPDGKWAYVGWSEAPADGSERINYVGIVNTRTLLLDKVLKQESYYQGGTRGQALHHIQAWTDAEGRDYVILQWGFGANGGPHHILDPNNDNRVFRSITFEDVAPIGHPFTTPSPDGKYVYVSMDANWIRSSEAPIAGIAKVDVQTGEVTEIHEVGHHPIGIYHTQDGKTTFVVDAEASKLYKIDDETNEVVDETSAGVAGPYGICMNWDESEIFLVGKGEGSHNRGNSIAMIDADSFSPSRAFNQPIYLGGSASSLDHCALHPDPEVNEIWVSNMNGWETIVVSLDTLQPTDWIETPNHGDTHGMAFVWYDNGWSSGELMADMGGPKSETMRELVRAAVAARLAS